jgi:NADPH:quinone reductase-like Zn-dependent oxidoreductase
MATHTAIATTKLGVIEAIQVPTPNPGDNEVLIKVEYTSMIAFDTYQTDLALVVPEHPHILGFNASGTVAKLGKAVSDLEVGDRVRYLFGLILVQSMTHV